MSRRKSNKSKAKWEVIRTEDELRAEAGEREAKDARRQDNDCAAF
jgi:hypothetical protein